MNNAVSAQQTLLESAQLFEQAANDLRLLQTLQTVAQASLQSLRHGGRILIAGNGGSAAEATHFAGELVGPFLDRQRRGLAAIPLGFDPSSLTAIGNDFGFEHVFSRQLQALARKGDLFWALTTSGNSKNILNALKTARELELVTVLFSNHEGGEARKLADHFLFTPPTTTPRVQELHLHYGHWICQTIEAGISSP